MKKVLIVAIMIICLFINSYAAETLDGAKYFVYNGFRQYQDQQTNKVSYSIKVEENTAYKFELTYYYNDKLVDTCTKEIVIEDDEIFKKVTCEIQKLGNGEYIFDAKLYSSHTDYQRNIFEREYIFENISASTSFEDLGDKTKVSIGIDGSYKDVTVKMRIPKEVIENLDEDNKDELIISEQEYKIIESDPLIAWNVENTPTEINYTINKMISEEQRKEFKLEITQTKSFALVKYIMFVLILLIIGLLVKPLLKENAKKTK